MRTLAAVFSYFLLEDEISKLGRKSWMHASFCRFLGIAVSTVIESMTVTLLPSMYWRLFGFVMVLSRNSLPVSYSAEQTDAIVQLMIFVS